MTRFALLVSVAALGCASPAPPPPVVVSPVPVVSAAPSAEPSPVLAPAPEDPPAPFLAIHRFAALDPGQRAALFATQGRALLRAGQRLYSLSPGRMDREPALEKALGGSFGAIGGRYPDALVADRQIPDKGEDWSSARQYVRIARGKVSVIGKAQQDAGHTISRSALAIAALPDGRILAAMDFEGGEGAFPGWLDFSPGPRSELERVHSGIADSGIRVAELLARADGSVVTAWPAGASRQELLRWAPGGAAPTATDLSSLGDQARSLFETTRGELFLITPKGVFRQVGGSFQREDPGAPIQQGWPLPEGGALFVTEGGDPLVRHPEGRYEPVRWPVITVEGRKLPAPIADAVCTREAGFWAIAADGLGLFHDRAPAEMVDLSRPDPAPARKGQR